MTTTILKVLLIVCSGLAYPESDLPPDEDVNGPITFQLETPTNGEKGAIDRAAGIKKQLHALNYVVNSLITKNETRRFEDTAVGKDGTLKSDLVPPLGANQTTFLRKKNPYDCSKDHSGPIRTDWLTAFAQGPNYYEALGLDMRDNGRNGVASLEKLTGLKFDFKSPVWKKVLYRKGESRITRYRRSVMKAFSPTLNAPVWITVDQDLEKLGEAVNPFQIQSSRGDDTVAAGELITSLPNGMPVYALLTRSAEGNLLLANSAPANLVSNNFPSRSVWKGSHFFSGQGENPSSIDNAHHCQTCHRDGLVGPQAGLELKEPDVRKLLTDLAKKAKSKDEAKSLADEAATYASLSLKEYEGGVEKNSENLKESLKKANAFLPDPKEPDSNSPLIADITKAYQQPLSLAQLAKELGSDQESVRKAVNAADKKSDSVPLSLLGTPPVLGRGTFEIFYCAIAKELEGLPGKKNGSKKGQRPTHAKP